MNTTCGHFSSAGPLPPNPARHGRPPPPRESRNPAYCAAPQRKSPSNTTSLQYYYFNPHDFSSPAYGVLGTAGRNFFRGPGENNTDLVLSKRVYLTEKRFFELRLEGYNVFNHTQFDVSASEGGSPVTGDFKSANFGRILDAAPGRTVQLAGKFYF